MAKSRQKSIKRLKRMKAENVRKSDQRERIERQIRKAERKDIVVTLLISSLIYVGVKTIISIF